VEDSRLPWENGGAPEGVGICLSGGGLRAASFSLGALQALQVDRGLLYGERSADLLAVVSGGSYLGAASMLTADRLGAAGDKGAPLGRDTPEAEYVVSHGSYLKNWDTAGKIALGGLVNMSAGLTLFVWTGVMFSAMITLAHEVGLGHPSSVFLQLALAVVFVIAARVTMRGLYLDGGPGRALLPLVGWLLILVSSDSTLALMRQVAPLSEAGWWTGGLRWLLALVACAAAIALAAGLGRIWPSSAAAQGATWLANQLPALIGAVLFCLVATGVARTFDRGIGPHASTADSLDALALFFGALIGAVVMQVVARTSLHGMYRDSLARCFSVARAGVGVVSVPATAQKLSDLEPPGRGSPGSFPRLLVCATANVIWDPADPSGSLLLKLPSSGRRKFASFVYSHDRCGLPGVDEASFATTDLERLTTRSGILPGQEPLVSLMSAVASTGAAISPAMGRRTSDLFRPLIALSNLRLGRWLPNPLSPRIRTIVSRPDANQRMRRKNGFGGSYDEFLPELFGLHYSDAPRIYISDGGHYDNLGLLALLQARCKEIWCIDAEADAKGKAGQLRTAIDLARSELGVEIDLDPTVFPGPAAGVLGQTHADGEIVYPDGAKGRLVVIKLGLTATGDAALREYQSEDKGFPCHGTFWPPWRVMWYSKKRFDEYAAVGYANALRASQAQPLSPAAR
jgi:hypothetical protein